MRPALYIWFSCIIITKLILHFIWQCIGLVLILSLIVLLAGCSVGSTRVSSDATERASLHFIGLPGLLGMVGSSTPINGSYSLTAAHVAKSMPQLDVVAYHPYCDIALIKTRNRIESRFMPVTVGDTVTLSGYSARTGLPLVSSGEVVRKRRLPGADGGHSCPAFASTAGAVQGMSGGSVTDSAGDLVGIIVAIDIREDESIFVPVTSFRIWLSEVMNDVSN